MTRDDDDMPITTEQIQQAIRGLCMRPVDGSLCVLTKHHTGACDAEPESWRVRATRRKDRS